MNKKWLAWSGVFAHQTVITPGYGQWVEREDVSEQLTSSTPTPVSPMLNCSFPSKVHFRKALGKKKNMQLDEKLDQKFGAFLGMNWFGMKEHEFE